MSSAARGRAQVSRRQQRATSKRKHRAVGAVITTLLVVAVAAVVILALANPPQYRVTPAMNNDLVRSMVSVPATDVAGEDPLVRPPGTVRSYYLVRGRVTTVEYVSHQPLAEEQQATLDKLAAAGWKSPANLPPGRVATEKDSFTGVFANQDSVLQLAMVRIKDITAATYIIQSAK